MLILLWVQDETSFDGFHRKAANIYRVNSALGKGASRGVYETTPAAVASAAMKEIPGVVNAVRTFPDWRYTTFSFQDRTFEKPVALYADSNLLQLLDFRLLAGDAKRLWPNVQSVVITESTAKKYFGGADPMGKVIMGDHKDPFVVSGVLADFPDNSSIKADLLFPIATFRADYADGKGNAPTMDLDWGNFGYLTLLEVQPGISLKAIGEKLVAIEMRQTPQIRASASEIGYELQPLTEIHLRKADGSAPLLQTVRIFEWIAVLILLIASINYVNLSTARAMLRAREVGVRKIIGAAKQQLFAQFIIESILFYAFSLVLAMGVIYWVIPSYNVLADKHFRLDLADARLWKVLAITGAGVLLASGVYPALLLASFEPLRAIKGVIKGVGNAAFRKILVTSQFVFSVALIIGTLVIGRQLAYIRDRDPGYNRSQVFSFYGRGMYEHTRSVVDQLQKEPAIKEVSVANDDIADVHNSTGDTDWDGKPVNSLFITNVLNIDERFIPMMKMSLAAGDNFSGRPVDSVHYILNETAVRQMGIANPIGKRFQLHEVSGTIIGVIRDFNFASLHTAVGPMVLRYRAAGGVFYVKTDGHTASKALSAVQTVWRQYNPGMPFSYNFLDQTYERMYRTDIRTGGLFLRFAGIAIFLSCLGLFGLATYTAQVRTREIGIRKVLGASVVGIVALLSRDFLRLIGIAIVIASPLAGWGMYWWLQDFVYRTTIDGWVFVVAGGAALGLALLTIGWQAVRAAMANPVKALRSE